jgi:hypothetical protein
MNRSDDFSEKQGFYQICRHFGPPAMYAVTHHHGARGSLSHRQGDFGKTVAQFDTIEDAEIFMSKMNGLEK